MKKRLHRTISPAWYEVREIRDLVTDELAHLSEDVKTAAAMTSSELLENAVKYGASAPKASPTTFTLTLSPEEIRIETRNTAASEDALQELKSRIERISASKGASDLYRRRLDELFANGDEHGKLGLFRIVYEGGFDLRCSNDDDVVTVTAVRKMP